MRITDQQIRQFHEVLKRFFGTTEYKLFLYGSRLHDHLKGGDIDLLIVTTDDGVDLFKEIHLDLLVELKKKPDIGQRRIDLKAATSHHLCIDPFLITIKDELIEL